VLISFKLGDDMSAITLALIVFSITLSAFAQIAMKSGMSSEPVQQALVGGSTAFQIACQVSKSGYVVLGIGLYGLGAISWLLVLAKLDVSIAYPFVAIGFILTMVLSFVFFGEPLNTLKVVGTLLVVVGVIIVAQS